MSPAARIAASGLFGLLVGAWLGRALFVWILDLSVTAERVGMGAAALLGLAICVLGALAEPRR